jgi:hypothetical protein
MAAINSVGDALAEVARGYGPKNVDEYRAACAKVAVDQRANAARYRREAEAYKPGKYLHDICLRMAKSADESAEEFETLAHGETPPRFEGTYLSIEAVSAEGR